MSKLNLEKNSQQERENELEELVHALSRNGLLWENKQNLFFDKLSENITRILGVQRVGIMLFNSEQTILRQIHQFSSENPTQQTGLTLKKINYPEYFEKLSQNSQLVSENALLDQHYDELTHSYLKPLQITAKVDTCIYKAGKLFAVLSVETLKTTRAWSQSELTFLSAIAQLLAQRFLYQDFKKPLHVESKSHSPNTFKQAEQEISASQDLVIERNRVLDLINSFSNKLHASKSEQEIYTLCINVMSAFESAPLVTIFEVEHKPYQLRFLMNSRQDELAIGESPTVPITPDFNGIALETGEPLYAADCRTDKRIMPALKEKILNDGFASIISIPLVHNKNKFGIILLAYRKAYPLSLDDIESLHSIAKTMSIALANAKTMQVLDYNAHHDSLTGLSNRAYFHKEFKQRILASRYEYATLFLLDLDRFKEINDTLGHFIGDKVLQIIGPRLENIVKDYQFVVSRLGGDEFTLVVFGLSNTSEVNLIASDLLTTLREPIKVDEIQLEINASVGIALYPHHGMDSHALLRSADVAMYSAKKVGGGFKYYDQNTDIHTPERLAMIAEMGSSINSGQLFLHYQPKININTNQVVGFEALARWEHPRLGLLNPNMFIPLIEMSNSIHQLTEEVLNQALAQQMEWRKQGKNYTIAVNISARNLIDDSLILLLKKMLKQYDTDPKMLELEITETALMHDAYRASDYLNQIAKLGVSLSIDDFGTGHSSLAYLQNLPIHKLKLDRKFIMGMINNFQGAKIVETIIALANTLDLEVVAEGVEDLQTLEKLRELKCDQAQGYFICKPNTWKNIEHWLSRA